MSPRMMRAQLLREYLDLPKDAPLSCIPVRPLPIGRSPRWDRKAIDAWLDEASGLAASLPASSAAPTAAPEDPEAALLAWKTERGEREAPRRA